MLRLVAALALLLAGCTSSDDGRLTVLAASSLQGVVPQLVAAFGEEVDVVHGSSSRLAAQVEAGAPGDVLLAADDVSLRRLDVTPVPFATTSMVVAVAPGNPGGVRSVHDLARVRVVLAAPEVPAGRYARQVLARAGVAVTPLSNEPDARAVFTKVAGGEADAALVYATDAGRLATVALAPEHDVVVTYTLAVLRPSPAAERFAVLVQGDEGRRLLRAAGYELPPESTRVPRRFRWQFGGGA